LEQKDLMGFEERQFRRRQTLLFAMWDEREEREEREGERKF
jgi:hypothetical protein